MESTAAKLLYIEVDLLSHKIFFQTAENSAEWNCKVEGTLTSARFFHALIALNINLRAIL